MSDYRQQLINSIEVSLATILDHDTHELVTRKILRILSDYDVAKRCTDIAIYDDTNDRMIKTYCACLLVDGKSEKTIYGYRRALKSFSVFIGKNFTDVGVYDIRYYLACEKDRGISNRTVENTRARLSAFFQWMTAENMIPKNPCMNIKPIKYADEVRKPFSPVELDMLRSSCRNLKERAIIEVFVTSGLRVSELCGLDVTDIDFASLTVHVRHGKGDKERITYINDVAKVHLQKYLLSRPDQLEAMFCNKNHVRIRCGGVRHILKELEKRSGVSNVHPHRFRRTFATGLAARGMPLQEIQRLMGHNNINTTLEYVYTDDKKIQASYRQFIA